MTFSTNRLNIEPVFYCISKMMMIMLCLFPTYPAMIHPCRKKLSMRYRIANRIVGLESFWMRCVVFFHTITIISFTIFGQTPFLISFSAGMLSFFALGIFLVTFFSDMFPFFGSSVFSAGIVFAFPTISTPFSKFRQWFNRFAFRALLCYDVFSHDFTSLKLWLKPFSGLIPAYGLFYYSNSMSFNKYNFDGDK